MGNIGPFELLLVVLVILLLFGSTKLPKLARSIGEASKEFKKGVNEPGAEEAEPPDKPATSKPATANADDSITMSRAELEALLAEREARARKDAPPPA